MSAIGGLLVAAAYLVTLAGDDFGWLALLVAPVALSIGIVIGCWVSMAATSRLLQFVIVLGALTLLVSAAPRNTSRGLMGIGLLLTAIAAPDPVKE